MPRYYFDMFNGCEGISDSEGLELPNLQRVQEVASTALAELARDVLPCCSRRRLRVDVRNAERRLVLTTQLSFGVLVTTEAAAVDTETEPLGA